MSRYRKLVTLGAILLAVETVAASRSWALFLDEGRLFKVTGQFYTQSRVRTQDTDAPIDLQGGGTHPPGSKGQLIQWRNLAFPAFEGDLGKAMGLSLLDNLSFRFAGRFIYDGAYDFGSSQYRRALRKHLVAANNPCPNPLDPHCELGLGGLEPLAVYQGTKRVEQVVPGNIGPCGNPANPPFFSPDCVLADQGVRDARLNDEDFEVFNPRDRFAQQIDPWEIYVNIEKRPLFLRIGRQNLAWGESDGQRLLDGNNPLDRLFGLPFDEDIDEQRIPLWMIRGNLQLIDYLGPLSSFGIEGYLVPGVIDVTQNPLPFGNDYPYGPPAGCDAQFIANEAAVENFGGNRDGLRGCVRSNASPLPTPSNGEIKTTIYERLPAKRMENSRFGLRVLGILFRDYTFSLGAYRSWADIPGPRVHFNDLLVLDPTLTDQIPGFPDDTPPLPTSIVAEITHEQVDVIGGTLSFFQPAFVPGVVRSEVGYFMDEPAMVGIANFGNIPLVPELAAGDGIFLDTFVPSADYLRWVVGYDIFQLNVPWISRTNNIVVVSQWFNSYRLTGVGKFRAIAQEVFQGSPQKIKSESRFLGGGNQPDGTRTFAPNYQTLGNITFQAFMMHGLLVPRITMVADKEGWGAVLPNVEYRLRDDLLVRLSYTAIFGRYFGGGFFRDRDQIGMRLTWLLS